jgi:hypothetical protein
MTWYARQLAAASRGQRARIARFNGWGHGDD